MTRPRVLAVSGATGALMLGLTGCSLDAVIWGPDGKRVIETTDDVVQRVHAGETLTGCDGGELELGDPERWTGLEAGEPERLSGDFWQDQVDLGATWTINLEQPDISTVENGGRYPYALFLDDREGGLCLVDVEWGIVSFRPER